MNCHECNEVIEGASTTLDGEEFCATCAEDFSSCDRCDMMVKSIEDLTSINDKGYHWCESCRDNYSCLCEGCSKWYKNTTTAEGSEYCSDCISDFYKCNDCGEYVSDSNTHSIGDYGVCDGCYDDNYSYCYSCESTVNNEDMNGEYCDSCSEDKDSEDKDDGSCSCPLCKPGSKNKEKSPALVGYSDASVDGLPCVDCSKHVSKSHPAYNSYCGPMCEEHFQTHLSDCSVCKADFGVQLELAAAV